MRSILLTLALLTATVACPYCTRPVMAQKASKVTYEGDWNTTNRKLVRGHRPGQQPLEG